jgi:predicted branched-subunit amino acid permease
VPIRRIDGAARRMVRKIGAVAGVAVAIAGYGLAFGVLAYEAGFGWGTVVAMSALAYSGGAQAVFVATYAAATPAAAVAAALLVNLRLVLYGLMAGRILASRSLPLRLAGAHLASDETIALSITAQPSDREWMYWGSGLTFFIAWLASTLAGIRIGAVIGDPAAVGLDVAFPAVFVALLYPMLRRRRALTAAVVAAATTAVATPFVPVGVPIVVAIVAAVGYLIMRGLPAAAS